jgi:DNA polymerase-1
MSIHFIKSYREIWAVDFEFGSQPGELPDPVCLVAWELNSGQKIRLWKNQIEKMRRPPYGIDRDCLFIAYYASAELGCHLSLGWPMPDNILDLYIEFRNLTNGLPLPCGKGLLGALTGFGLDGLAGLEKDSMRNLVLRGGPWTDEERDSILRYCESDVEALIRLFNKIAPRLDIPRSLLRGRYMKAVARIERTGVPIDTDNWNRLITQWESLQARLIEAINRRYNIYEGHTFKMDNFSRYLSLRKIPWPRIASGKLDLSDNTFREMARIYPDIAPLRELRVTLSQMRLRELSIGRDGRNRCLLSAFQSRTGRNQPSNTKFIFGPAVWLRSLIRPEPGHGIAYIDWSQQEFGIAAALSGDKRMMDAYISGDPYLTFAKQVGAIPQDATKQSHPNEREQFKACVLAVQYGMGGESLARRIGQPIIVGRELLRLHREAYPVFWKWSDAALDFAILRGELWTTFGWKVHIDANTNPRFLRNFLMQANGAEMLRLACCFATERGIRVCAPVHDALLIEAPLSEIDQTVVEVQEAMARASAFVLDGFALRSEAKIVSYPERYLDQRGRLMWQTIEGILRELEEVMTCSPENNHLFTDEQVPVHRRPAPYSYIL